MKKDILAILTFLATGFLFYLAQMEAPTQKAFFPGDDCDATERIVVEESVGDAPSRVLPEDSGRRDS